MYSWPGVKSLLKGRPPWIWAGGPCWMISRSVAQMATPSMRTRTSALFGAGTGLLTSDNSPGSPRTHAFMVSGTGNAGSTFTSSGCGIVRSPPLDVGLMRMRRARGSDHRRLRDAAVVATAVGALRHQSADDRRHQRSRRDSRITGPLSVPDPLSTTEYADDP